MENVVTDSQRRQVMPQNRVGVYGRCGRIPDYAWRSSGHSTTTAGAAWRPKVIKSYDTPLDRCDCRHHTQKLQHKQRDLCTDRLFPPPVTTSRCPYTLLMDGNRLRPRLSHGTPERGSDLRSTIVKASINGVKPHGDRLRRHYVTNLAKWVLCKLTTRRSAHSEPAVKKTHVASLLILYGT